jgi:hypothetical protein
MTPTTEPETIGAVWPSCKYTMTKQGSRQILQSIASRFNKIAVNTSIGKNETSNEFLYFPKTSLTLNDHDVTPKSMEVKEAELHLNDMNMESGFSVGRPWKLITHPESIF